MKRDFRVPVISQKMGLKQWSTEPGKYQTYQTEPVIFTELDRTIPNLTSQNINFQIY